MLVIGTTEGVFVAETGERAGTNLVQRDVKVLRQANGRLLAGATDGVYRSADGGTTWQHIGLQDREVLEVAPAPQDPRLVYAGTARRRCSAAATAAIRGRRSSRSPRPSTLARGACRRLPTGRPERAPTASSSMPATRSAAWLASKSAVSSAPTTTAPPGRRACPAATRISTASSRIHSDPRRCTRRPASVASAAWPRSPTNSASPACLAQTTAGVRGAICGAAWGASTPVRCVSMLGRRMPSPWVPRPARRRTSRTACQGGAKGLLYQSTDRGTTWRAMGDADHTPSVAALLCVTPAPDRSGNVLVGTDQGEVWHVATDRTPTRTAGRC